MLGSASHPPLTFEQFVGAYPREYTDPFRPSYVPDDYAIFEGFQREYSGLVHDLLSGTGADALPGRYAALAAQWYDWGPARLDQLVRAFVLGPPGEPGSFDGHGALVFAQLTFAMQQSWAHALAQMPKTGVEVRMMQLFLCGLAVSLHQAREWAIEHDNDSESAAERRAFHSGMLSEIDTAVLLLELSKQHKWLTVLPAPAAFESLAGRSNTDLLLLDLEHREAVGVQVKTRITDSAVVTHYDSDRVVVIDGAIDLGNERLVEVPRRSGRWPVSWPGLLSVHYLASRSDASQDFRRAVNREWLTQKRAEARRLRVGTTDYRARALTAVRGRILSRFSRTTSL